MSRHIVCTLPTGGQNASRPSRTVVAGAVGAAAVGALNAGHIPEGRMRVEGRS